MEIQQWEDKNLSHFSYAILSDCEKKIIIVDPARNPEPYIEYAKQKNATIAGIIETHPHADFVSSHLELHELTGAPVYVHSLVGVAYNHIALNDGDSIEIGKIKLTALHTPGHSPDSICILLEHEGKQKAVFTGDTLFIGDCGRPDLREGAGNIQAAREELARQMYHSLRNKLMVLNDDVIVYPAHGAGTLCGKNLSKANNSTIGKEKQTNWSLQPTDEAGFVKNLLTGQPFIPAYFPFDVELNRKGAPGFKNNTEKISIQKQSEISFDSSVWIVDTRNDKAYKEAHLPLSVNIMANGKFETWLGSIIAPGEAFYLTADNATDLKNLIERAAAIGYEQQIKAAFVFEGGNLNEPLADTKAFRNNTDAFTIVDIRNPNEVNEYKPFQQSIAIPLPELRKRINEIPTDKPIMVHCAAGYRSAAGSSIIKSVLKNAAAVYDLSEAIKTFK